MAHGNAVTDSDRRKYDRHTARFRHAQLHGIDDLIQIHMSGNDLIVRTDNTDHRFVHLFLRKSQCIEQTSVRRLLYACLNIVASHKFSPLSLNNAIYL